MFVGSVLNFNLPLKNETTETEYNGIANYKFINPLYLHLVYLVWTKITIYVAITLTTLVKSLKFNEKNPHAVYSFFIACS